MPIVIRNDGDTAATVTLTRELPPAWREKAPGWEQFPVRAHDRYPVNIELLPAGTEKTWQTLRFNDVALRVYLVHQTDVPQEGSLKP